jgi:hypothetical protein
MALDLNKAAGLKQKLKDHFWSAATAPVSMAAGLAVGFGVAALLPALPVVAAGAGLTAMVYCANKMSSHIKSFKAGTAMLGPILALAGIFTLAAAVVDDINTSGVAACEPREPAVQSYNDPMTLRSASLRNIVTAHGLVLPKTRSL